VVSVEENGKQNFPNEKYEEVKTLEKKTRQSDRCPLAQELEKEVPGKTLRVENSARALKGRKSNQKTTSTVNERTQNRCGRQAEGSKRVSRSSNTKSRRGNTKKAHEMQNSIFLLKPSEIIATSFEAKSLINHRHRF
jgi:hypothetical protein